MCLLLIWLMIVLLVRQIMTKSGNDDLTVLAIMGPCYMVFIHGSVENRFGTSKWSDASLSFLAKQSLM